MHKTTNDLRPVVTTPRSTPPQSLSHSEEKLAILPEAPTCGYYANTTEQSEEMTTEWLGDEQERLYDDCNPCGTEDGGGVESPQVQGPRQLFTRPSDISDTPTRLSKEVSLSRGKAWTISAPDIERAIQTLLASLNRNPTDIEIAQQLRISVAGYHEALAVLKDIELEIGVREVSRSENSVGDDLMCLRNGPDSAVFLCLRSEMLKLFGNAVRLIPERERLVISLRYCEDIGDKELSLVLAIAESTITHLSASARLHLRARLFGAHDADYYVWGDGVRPADSRHKWSSKQKGPNAHVYMFGGQDGWLPVGHSWECLGPNATYKQYVRTYLFINDECELKQVRRLERRELTLNDLRSQSES
jgi:hypothetical protein